MQTKAYRKELFIIVCAQFMCTSLWFAGNAVAPQIIRAAALPQSTLAYMTSAVQFGFISGTLIFSLLAVADRFKPSTVFFCCALIGALFNMGITIKTDLNFILTSRFLTGFFLAGIYPVGMKIASDYFEKGLGRSLGWLVGALVLGTAFPHLLRSFSSQLNWKYIVYATSASAIVGGLIMFLLVPDGPYRRIAGAVRLSSFIDGFRNKNFRAVAFGYFGHMWELYAFWAFVPVIWKWYAQNHADENLNTAWLSFLVIASGAVACVLAGFLSAKFSAKRIATIALIASGVCCFVSPLMLQTSFYPMLLFMFFWGLTVVADSPMFSSLVATYAPTQSRGTALTIVTCIGFAITIISIQILNTLNAAMQNNFNYLILGLGPVLGVVSLLRYRG
jgi:MFS family permease